MKPRKSDAILFFSLLPNGTTDENSLHGSCPIIEGDKWSPTKRIHVKAYDFIKMGTSDECIDENDDCAKWATVGECMDNPTYMIGSPHSNWIQIYPLPQHLSFPKYSNMYNKVKKDS